MKIKWRRLPRRPGKADWHFLFHSLTSYCAFQSADLRDYSINSLNVYIPHVYFYCVPCIFIFCPSLSLSLPFSLSLWLVSSHHPIFTLKFVFDLSKISTSWGVEGSGKCPRCASGALWENCSVLCTTYLRALPGLFGVYGNFEYHLLPESAGAHRWNISTLLRVLSFFSSPLILCLSSTIHFILSPLSLKSERNI